MYLRWFENGPHSLIYLNTWSPSSLGRSRRYALLSGCHCGMGFDVSADLQYSQYSLLCLLLMDQDVSLPLFYWLWRFASEIKKQLRQCLYCLSSYTCRENPSKQSTVSPPEVCYINFYFEKSIIAGRTGSCR